ncbi:MAG: 3-methylornithine--L-lysine ligase PylC [Desulfosarcinaceae bacterium]|nr:3-methylornithine--L-lysine ligase PylC [Desulfosarcinaceae bacterium]
MRLLVVGGRLQGVEAAYLAKKAGFWVRVVDKAAMVPAMHLGDHFIQVDVTSPQGLALATEGIDLILPALENPAVLQALAESAPELGIPLAFDLAAHKLSSSKRRSDQLFASHQIPAPEPWPACGYPVMVKPDRGSGSEGVRLLTEGELLAIQIDGGFPPEGMVAQQYLEGPSYSVEVIGVPGNYHVMPATELEMDAGHDCKRVLAPSGLGTDAADRLAAIGRACAEAIQLTGIMDVEVIRHEGVFKVLEVDARLPSQTPIAVLHSSGINQVALLAALFQGGQASAHEPLVSQDGVILEHIAIADGHLRVLGEHIMAVTEGLRHETGFFGADEALTTYRPGAPSWVATLIITAADRAAAWEKRSQVMANLKQTFDLVALAAPRPDSARSGAGQRGGAVP